MTDARKALESAREVLDTVVRFTGNNHCKMQTVAADEALAALGDTASEALAAISAYLSAVGQKAGTVEDTQANRERENTAFHDWWKSSGHEADPTFTLTMQNCAHAAWQARALIHAPSVAEAAEPVQETRDEAKARILREHALGNLTPLGVANHLRRAGFRLEAAVDIANSLTHPAPSPVVPSGLEALVREIATHAAGHVRNNADAEAVENIVTSRVAAALSADRASCQARVAELERQNEIFRQHIGEIHNRVRHTLSAEIEAASDKAFKAMSAIEPLRAARSALEGK